MATPKSFSQILADMIEKDMYKTSINDIKAGSAMSSLLDQLQGSHHARLARFLYKLDPARFRESVVYTTHYDLFSAGIVNLP